MFQASKAQKINEGLQFDPNELELLPKTQKEQVLNALEWKGDGFDTRTHIVEPKSGTLLKYQPYRRFVEDGCVTYFRRDEHGVEQRYDENGRRLDSHGPKQNIGAPPVPAKGKVDGAAKLS